MKKMLLLVLVIVIATTGCSKSENANNAENNTLDESPESEITLSDIIEASSVICVGKIIDSRDIDKNMTAVNIAVTSELKGAIEETKIELYLQKSLQSGYIYIFFLCENSEKSKESIKYDVLSIASYNEYDGTILYDEALILDVDYKNIDGIKELKEYIQKGNI